ncbi:zinc/cadmium/mercury/lead-transporting ATPase [Halolamina pelagica]|uniref:Zinc/cadmium/mercury/lead-transporting ATPase n=1 Tax=Halolamina pelagica TaxID=699431 RepID=A0A0P7HXG1_9EURY|nr:zinc/cadmium/mercury/lead-transporting ATPase [Halolamina pelagica]
MSGPNDSERADGGGEGGTPPPERDRAGDSDAPEPVDTPSASVELRVPGMDCPSCAGKVEQSVRKLDGIDGVDPEVTTGKLTVDYDPDSAEAEDVAERVEKAGYEIDDGVGEATETFTAPTMDCPSCAGTVENAITAVDGVTGYRTEPTTGKVVVTFDQSRTTADAVRGTIEGAGYEVVDSSVDGDGGVAEPDNVWRSRRAIKTWISGVFTLLGLAFEFLLGG